MKAILIATIAAATMLAGCATNESTEDDQTSTGGNEISGPMKVVNGTDETPTEPPPTEPAPSTNETNETSETPTANETNETA